MEKVPCEEIQNVPKRSNHVECGVFVIYFVDCTRQRFDLKSQLSNEELTNYRGVINQCMNEYKRSVLGEQNKESGKRKGYTVCLDGASEEEDNKEVE